MGTAIQLLSSLSCVQRKDKTFKKPKGHALLSRHGALMTLLYRRDGEVAPRVISV